MMAKACNSPKHDHMPRPDGWVSETLAAAILLLARTGMPFTADDLWGDRFGFGDAPDPLMRESNVKPQEVGAAFQIARRKNIIRLVGYRPSTRRGRRHGLVRVWIGSDGAHA